MPDRALPTIVLVASTALIVLVLPLATAGAPLAAQKPCRTSGNEGALQGRVVDDRSGARIGGALVIAFEPACRVVADVLGNFRISGVPAGHKVVFASRPGYGELFPTLTATVEPGQTTQIQIRLRPSGPVEDCRDIAACAPLLDERPTPITDIDAQFRLAAYAAAIAIAWQDKGTRRIVCVSEGSIDVASELRKRWSGTVAPSADCDYPNRAGSGGHLHHIPTGEAAFAVTIRRARSLQNGLRRADVYFTIATLWSQGWQCDFEHVPDGWRPTVCLKFSQS